MSNSVVGALGGVAALEGRTDAEIDVAGAHRHRLVGARGAAAAGLEHAGLELGAQRQHGVLDLVAAPFEARLAGLVGVGRRERDEGRLELLALAFRSERVFAEVGERLVVDGDAHVGLDREARRRRAVEEVGRHGEAVDLAGAQDRLVGRELDLELLRHEILDRELDAADRRRLGIDMGGHRPAAAPRGFRQVDRLVERARGLQGVGEARELGAVRPLDDQRHRHVGERDGAVVAQHGHELHGLAGAIDAAFGVEEGVDRTGLVAAGDAAVGEVERRLAEFEAGEFLLAGVRRHHGEGLRRAAALQEPGGEIDTAVGGRDRLGDRLVAARQQHELEAGQRLGALQGAGEDIEPVLAGEAGEGDVGVHHPHAGRRAAARSRRRHRRSCATAAWRHSTPRRNRRRASSP